MVSPECNMLRMRLSCPVFCIPLGKTLDKCGDCAHTLSLYEEK